MDITVKAINLKSIDINESDKLCTLYSIELGKFTAVLKGVKKAAAKLKFAAEPFCFGEYSLSNTKGRFVVTNCLIDTQFYDIRLDIDKYYAGSSVLECVEHCGAEKIKNPALFVLVLKALKNLCFDDDAPGKILAHFMLSALKISGYKLALDECVSCGNVLSDKVFFSDKSGGFTCGLCREGIVSSKAVYNALRLLSITDYEKLSTLKINEEILHKCLKILEFYFNSCIGSLKVLPQYLSKDTLR